MTSKPLNFLFFLLQQSKIQIKLLCRVCCKIDNSMSLSISAEQLKLLSSSIRVRIMYTLNERAMTSKQVAECLKESPGNVHYHIQRLYKGGLLELVETKVISGIVEKYYKSKADRFEIKDLKEHMRIPGITRSRMFSYLSLTEEESQTFMNEMIELLFKWENRPRSEGASELVFDASIVIPDNVE